MRIVLFGAGNRPATGAVDRHDPRWMGKQSRATARELAIFEVVMGSRFDEMLLCSDLVKSFTAVLPQGVCGHKSGMRLRFDRRLAAWVAMLQARN